MAAAARTCSSAPRGSLARAVRSSSRDTDVLVHCGRGRRVNRGRGCGRREAGRRRSRRRLGGRVHAQRPERRVAVRVHQERVRGHRAVRGQERDRHAGPGVGRPGVRAHPAVPARRAVHRVRGAARLRGQVLARAGAVPVLVAARRERPERRAERRRHVPGPDRRAVGARLRAGQHHGTAGAPNAAQDLRRGRQNGQGEARHSDLCIGHLVAVHLIRLASRCTTGVF